MSSIAAKRILVTGSRDWDANRVVEDALADAIWALEAVNPLGRQVILVSGACPTGADSIAEEIAKRFGLAIERHPADWMKHGKRAGFLRNAEMVSLDADICLAFIRNRSKGATMTADLAEKAGIQTLRFTQSD